MKRLNDGTPTHQNSRVAFNYMLQLVEELNALQDEVPAQKALEAFVMVRRRYQRTYTKVSGSVDITPSNLPEFIRQFVLEDSEYGRRVQAIVAGLIDVFVSSDRVESGRINDPSRKHPGDVCVRSLDDLSLFEKAIEVRDKPVQETDVQIFGRKCVEMNVQEAALVMVSQQ